MEVGRGVSQPPVGTHVFRMGGGGVQHGVCHLYKL